MKGQQIVNRLLRSGALVAVSLLAACAQKSSEPPDYTGPVADWPAFGATIGGGHYSPATQITRDNVHRLERAWEYRSGDLREAGTSAIELVPGDLRPTLPSSWQLTPILVDDTLYGCSSFNRVFALDPQTGEEKWSYDPQVDDSKEFIMNCRGVSSWKAAERGGARCEHRIVAGTMDGRLLVLDGVDGKLCEDFGNRGVVDLTEGLGEFVEHEHALTSPPAIVGDRIVVGGFIIDRNHNDMPSGVVRAYDIRSGALIWYWDPIPPAETHEFGPDGKPLYRRGTTNVWSIISADVERDLVFLPTGNTSTDFYGGLREDGIDRYSASVVALRASTGEIVWHFQMVHHDVWDYDATGQPTLFDLKRDGRTIPALVQTTKMGHLFILNRETGEPLFPVEERPVPQAGAVPEERLSPTQPFPLKPEPLVPGGLTADDAWGFVFWERNACRKKIEGLLNQGIFTPPSTQGSVFFPADYGGNNWGTPAIDPERGLIILNTLLMPASVTLVPRDSCDPSKDPFLAPQGGTPYCVRIEPLLSPAGAPCIAPPWGTLTAIDFHTGEKRWEVPLGNLEELAPWPLSRTKGSPNIGGPSVTASGLTFIAATTDRYIRAFDSETGEELWKAKLPTGGHAVPTIYRAAANHKQYVVIAAGGHYTIPQSPPGDWLIAFALPD